jgi:hypothetical protein
VIRKYILDKITASQLLIDFCKTDFLGRPKHLSLRMAKLKKLPKPQDIIDFVVMGRREGVTAEQVKQVLVIFCAATKILCPLVTGE